MGYPRHLLSPGEEVITEFRPHWQFLLTPLAITVLAVAAGFVVVLTTEGTTQTVLLVVVVALWLILVVRRVLEWLTTQYVITNERVIFRAGILSRRGKEIPLEVVNDVSFHQSFLERLVGSGDLLIESAGEMGQSRYTDIPRPERLQSLIYQARETRTIALSGTATSPAAELEALARLRDQGILTEDEFQAQKRRLLGDQ